MFELDSDPAFEFADPKMAVAIREGDDRQGLFADLLFRKGEEGEDSDEDVVFDG